MGKMLENEVLVPALRSVSVLSFKQYQKMQQTKDDGLELDPVLISCSCGIYVISSQKLQGTSRTSLGPKFPFPQQGLYMLEHTYRRQTHHLFCAKVDSASLD